MRRGFDTRSYPITPSPYLPRILRVPAELIAASSSSSPTRRRRRRPRTRCTTTTTTATTATQPRKTIRENADHHEIAPGRRRVIELSIVPMSERVVWRIGERIRRSTAEEWVSGMSPQCHCGTRGIRPHRGCSGHAVRARDRRGRSVECVAVANRGLSATDLSAKDLLFPAILVITAAGKKRR